ncbi:uncharacterized protein LOC106458273 [Limulus polyphemus]|uniref:Uncharacterized protein LOC106458273 n=1 Tax=Limulus polyphemus TaxID=6850 RepID=A0ABM1B228_LIMPO|nr:uncharacterized protein LOC106458273 [Limulus polyphemus]
MPTIHIFQLDRTAHSAVTANSSTTLMANTDPVPTFPPLVTADYGIPDGYLIPYLASRDGFHRVAEHDQPLDFSKKSRSPIEPSVEVRERNFTLSPTHHNEAVEQLETSESFVPFTAKTDHAQGLFLSSPSTLSGKRNLGQSSTSNSLFPSEVELSPKLDGSPDKDCVINRLHTTIPSIQPNTVAESRKTDKYIRPFKAYPNDPLQGYYNYPVQFPLTVDAITARSFLPNASDQAYLDFREHMLMAMKKTQETRRSGSRQQCLRKDNSDQRTTTDSVRVCTASESLNCTSKVATSESTFSAVLTPTSETTTHTTTISTSVCTNSAPLLSRTVDGSSNDSFKDSDKIAATDSPVSSENSQSTTPLSLFTFRKRSQSLTDDKKDEAYWERRKKNNEAAKRSRDSRRAKEDEIAIRAAYLEQENLKLRVEVATLKNETLKLRCLLYSS